METPLLVDVVEWLANSLPFKLKNFVLGLVYVVFAFLVFKKAIEFFEKA